MRIIFKLLILAVAMLAFGGLRAQTVIGTGAVNQLTYQKGGYGADSVMGMPVRDTFCNNFPAFRCAGRMTVQPGTFNVYVNTGTYWKQVGALGIPNLQQVTDVGATTTHDVTVGGLTATGDIQAGQTVFTEDIDVNGEIIYQSPASGEGNILIKNGSNVVKVSSISTASLLTDTIFVSQIPGIHQNSNVVTGGGTSDRDLIQAVLDLNPKVLIQDGASLIDTVLIIGSNTTFLGLGQHTGFFLDSGSRSFVIINRGGYSGNAGIVDSNITLGNMYLNGNGMDQVDPVYGGATPENYGLNVINMFGVRNLRMNNITTTKGAQWGIGLFNVKDFFIDHHVHLMDWTYYSHYTVAQYIAGQVPLSQDAINFRGGCENGIYTNARISSSDDALAINPIRYAADPPGLNHDPIRHILISNVILENSSLGVAVYSDTLVEDIHFQGISGTTQCRWGYVGANAEAAGGIIDYNGGRQRNVTFDNINVRTIAPFPNTYIHTPYYFVIDGNTEGTLSITNYNIDSMQSYPYLVRQLPGNTSEQITINGMNMVDRNNVTSGFPRILLSGTVNQFTARNIGWYRGADLAQQGRLVDLSDNVQNTVIEGVTARKIDTLISVAGTTAKELFISDIVMDSCATDGGAVSVNTFAGNITLHTNNISTGNTPVLVGNGATTVVNAGGVKNASFGIIDIYSPLATSNSVVSRGLRSIGSSGFTGIVGDNALYSIPIGIWAPDRTTFMSGMWFTGTGSTLTSTRFGASTSTYAIGITHSNHNVDMPNNLSVTGTTTLSGVTTITNASNAMFSLRRSISTVNAGNDITFAMHNASSSFVNYFVLSGQIESNTAGSHNGRIVFAPAVNGTITERARMTSAGKWGIDVTNPTAMIHIKAGTATANTAPLKLTSGTNLTTPEAGAFEYNGTSLFFSPGASRLRAVLSDNTIPSAGQLAIGDGTNYTVGSLVGGTGINVSYAGNLTISNTNVESLTGSGAGTLTLSTASNYIFTGTTTTWTLPAAGSNAGVVYKLKNKGSGDITLVTTGAANEIYTTAATNTYTITPGSAIILVCDGSHFNVE